jgi:hypothetical protein
MKSSFFHIHCIAGKAIGTSGFDPSCEGFFRLSAFGHRENVIETVERIKKNLKFRNPGTPPYHEGSAVDTRQAVSFLSKGGQAAAIAFCSLCH